MTSIEQPDGIIITISQKMLKERTYKSWLADFYRAMNSEDLTYWMKLGYRPKQEVLYVYLCIGNKVRFRCQFVKSMDHGWKYFDSGRKIYGLAWVVLCGPVVRAPKNMNMTGFRGFRYTEKLF